MKRGERLSGLLFRAVVTGFSAVFLLLSLFGQIQLVRRQENLARMESRLSQAQEEKRRMQLELAQRCTLDRLEQIARERLGMHAPEQGQIRIIEIQG